jgi:hypothetical protein
MSARLHGLASTALAFALVLALPSAHAQSERPSEPPASDSAETAEARGARAFFEIGAQAYDRGDYESALAAFREAYTRAERPGLLFSMAQAHRRAYFATNDAQHLTLAVQHYRKYLESGDPGRRRDAEEALEQLVPLTTNSARESDREAPSPRVGKLMIASTTPGATLYVDGAVAPHLPFVVTVEPGPHTLTLTAPGYRRHVRTIPVPEGAAFALDIPLEELPGSLALTGTPGSEVLVDGRLVGSLPLPPVAVEPGRHRLSVQKAGHRSVTRTVELVHGRSLRLDAQLEVSRQRRASIALFWVGGLSLVGASVLGVAALDRQSDTSEVSDQLDQGSITTDQRMRHNRALHARDRLRGAAFGVGGVGAACLLVGAVLMAFDRPRPPPLLDPTPPEREPKPVPTRGELIAGPTWDMDHIGIEARGAF